MYPWKRVLGVSYLCTQSSNFKQPLLLGSRGKATLWLRAWCGGARAVAGVDERSITRFFYRVTKKRHIPDDEKQEGITEAAYCSDLDVAVSSTTHALQLGCQS